MAIRIAFILLSVILMQTRLAAQTREIIREQRVLTPKTLDIEIDVPQFSPEKQVRLSLEARVDSPQLGGSNPWLMVSVNDNSLTAEHLLNKRNEFKLGNGLELQWHNDGHRWRVLYSPDFRAAMEKSTSPFAVAKEDDPYRYVWDVTRFVKPGKNRLKLNCLQLQTKAAMMELRNVFVEVGTAIKSPSQEVTPAPTGPLPTFVDRAVRPVPIRVALSPQGFMRLTAMGMTWNVATRASLAGGQWREPVAAAQPFEVNTGESANVTWQAGAFRIERTVTVWDDRATVIDTISNTTNNLAGLILHHRATSAAKPNAVFLAGSKTSSGQGGVRESANPSVFARYGKVGLGFVAEDDVFRVHALCVSDANGAGLTDDHLALEGGTSVKLEWSIYPVEDGDYWTFINAVRRDWGSNIPIPGPFVFSSEFKPGQPAEEYARWMNARSMKYVCGGIAKYPDGKYAHGTGILYAPRWIANEKEWTAKILTSSDDVTPMQYFHAQICTEPDAVRKYADSRLIDEKGVQVNYPYTYPLPVFVPTRENSYGKTLVGCIDTLIDETGARGLYWDEQAFSVNFFHYGEPWDGVTAMIDPNTHAITRKVSCVTLLMQPLQLDIIRNLRDKNIFIMGNAQARTRTIHREKLVFFNECGVTYTKLLAGHLGTPVGLGNHHPENSVAASALHVRDMLRYGSIYHGHQFGYQPPEWNFVSVMYPITPVELHEGYVLGLERIHTAVSGRFGWSDGSPADVYVVDAAGARVEPPPVRELKEGRLRLYEIRMPGDHFAILVRRNLDDAQ
jgi:hypothetical protein